MSNRRELLTHLFRLLEEQQIAYCVLRNYTHLYEETGSDVDLLTVPDRAEQVISCCIQAAKLCGQHLVQRTRFVNHSLVFWNGDRGFTRIDVDTEKRWKRFHLFDAAEILASRRIFQPRGLPSFHIPDITHEAVIVLTQAMWQGTLTERYARRLTEIRAELGSHERLSEVFHAAFGLRKNLLGLIEDKNLISNLCKATRRHALLKPYKLLRLVTYTLNDLARLVYRRRNLPGAFVRLMGVEQKAIEAFASRLAILFPIKKNLIVTGSATPESRHKPLFKGGMLTESHDSRQKPAALLRSDWLQPDRGFAAVRVENRFHFIHIGTGFMSSADSPDEFPQHICASLAKLHTPGKASSRGGFVVILGLDGAGKTTLARNLTSELSGEHLFQGVRYFHWLPGLGNTFEFPLPEPGNQARKPKLAGGFVQSVLSVLRLTKNLVRAHLAWWIRLRPLRNSGHLVLVDRYFYNYYLDPVSVKYYGPRWVLDALTRLFPRPEIVITLSAPPEVLLRRKQELSEAEMREQAEVLKRLQFTTPHVIAADASEPAAQVAEKVMCKLREILS